MENLAKNDAKNSKRIVKSKDKEKEVNKLADGTELTEVKVEVTSNHRNQKSQVWHYCTCYEN